MASLLVLIFAVEFAVALVNAIGATTINNLARSPRPLIPRAFHYFRTLLAWKWRWHD